MTDMDFNTADTQDSAFALIPANTLAKVCLTIRPGGAGPEGWLTQSRSSSALSDFSSAATPPWSLCPLAAVSDAASERHWRCTR